MKIASYFSSVAELHHVDADPEREKDAALAPATFLELT
jgi:hypothetical protein